MPSVLQPATPAFQKERGDGLFLLHQYAYFYSMLAEVARTAAPSNNTIKGVGNGENSR
jgi:hypothetical protein